MRRLGGLERRVPWLLGLLAAGVLGLLGLSWSAYGELLDAQRERAHTQQVLAEVDALERATAAQPALVLCAAQGASPRPLPPPPDTATPLARLTELLPGDGQQLRNLDAARPYLDALRRDHTEPLAAACRDGRRLGTARALEISTLGVMRRSEVEARIAALRGVAHGLLGERQARLASRTDAAGRLFALFAAATVVLAVVATLGMHGVTSRLAESNRRLRHEATERGLAQELQREVQRRLELVLDHIPDAVVAFDAEARVLWINPAGESLFGRRREDLRRQPIAMLVPELDRWLHWPDTQPEGEPDPEPESKRPQARTARRETMVGLHADGSEIPVEVALVQTRVGGERVGVCVCRDLRELERMDRMKHDFVSMVSHELRTPLTSLRASLSMLADGMAGELDAPVKRLVGLAHDNSERLVALVNDILDFEKLRARELRMTPEPVDLVAEAHAAVEACEGYARGLGVTVALQASYARVPAWADPLRLGQILGNLLSNAIKFSPQGGEVEVEVGERDGRAQVWVADRGPGVPPAFVERLFEPFAQADDLPTRQRGGTGLGLAISRALAEQMGGAITLEPPRPGRGAVFRLALPKPPAAAPEPGAGGAVG